jgi:uncharacterized repeat protein (TIGR01451 family)
MRNIFIRNKLLKGVWKKVKRVKLLKKFAVFNIVLFVSGIYNLALISPVHADSFYSTGGNVANCHVATVVGVQYNSIGGNGVNWDSSRVGGASGNWIQSHHFTEVADITYPDAHRYPYIADKISVPPNTHVEIGAWTYSYANHGVNIDAMHLFTSRPDTSRGDLTRLGAGGNYGSIGMNGFPTRNGKYITTGSLGYFPDRVSTNGQVVYSFNTIQPMQVQSFTATPQWNGENLSVQYTLQLRNISTYTLNNIRVRDVMPSGAVYDQTHNFSAGQTRTITYTEDWGTNYPNNIVNDPVTIWDNNSHEETQSEIQPSVVSFDDPAIRPAVVMRDDTGAPANWNAGQPVWGQVERPPIIVELIPYWFNSEPVALDVNPLLTVAKTVSDIDENLVQENETRPDEEITYDITVRNAGGRADNVVVTDDYDESLIEILDSNGGNDNGDVITWNLQTLEHGEVATFQITAKTISPLSHGIHHTPNTVTVDSDQTTPIEDSTQTNITAEVIMEIDKQVSDSDEDFGDSNHLQGAHPDNTERLSTYSINIKNSGDADAHHVTIHDDVSEVIQNASILNISNDGVLTTTVVNGELTGEILWNIGDLPQGENRTVTFDALFNAGIDDLLEINNIAEVRTDEVPPVSDSTITTTHSPILEIEKDDGVEFAEPNQSVNWVINARNTGTGNAYNVEVYDFVPERMQISNISDGGVWDENERRILWSTTEPHYILNGSYNPDPRSTWGSSKELSFDAQLDQMFLDGDVILTNLAILETDFYPPIETEHDLPVLTPILEIVKHQELTEVVAPGQPITYTIEYRNIGTGHSPDTVITDTLPEHTQFIEFVETDSNIEGFFDIETGEILWDLGTLDPDSEGSVSFMVVIEIPTQSDTEIRNVAIIDSPITEPEESEVITSTVDSCCLGGFIWEDANNDGIYDDNEYGIQGVTINIKWGDTEYLEGEYIEIFTDENGHYEYTGLPYHTALIVSVDVPDGFDEITTDSEYKLVLLPPNDDGTIEDYELDGVHYLTAGQCINFLNAGIYRDIILAQTGQSILIPLVAGLIFMATGVSILFIRRSSKKK